MKTRTASCTIYFRSPIGPMKIVGTGDNLTALDFVSKMGADDSPNPPSVLKDTYAQLDEYFLGRRQAFTLPLAPHGTEFQQMVWRELQKVPFGRTVAYGDIARAMGRPGASRAVGGANNKNPISIIIPCHRIIGADKSLTGYGGGMWRKAWLLKHENIRIVNNRIIY